MDGSRKKIIIDTDIADDIDDAIALAFALGSPELDILGVTVVYGDVRTRAKVARKLLRSDRRRERARADRAARLHGNYSQAYQYQGSEEMVGQGFEGKTSVHGASSFSE